MTRNRILVIAYIVFLAALFEGIARLAFSVPQISRRLFVDDDYSYRRHWVRRYHNTGRHGSYAFDLYDSTKGWRSKPNLREQTAFGGKVLSTNSRGLRGRRDFDYIKSKPRVLVLGDSFTFGDEVGDEETYSHYLQKMLPQSEIINLGVHGYGHDQMLILLREEGPKYQPDIVIIGFLALDMPRNLLQFRDFAKPRFILNRGSLELTGTPVPHPEQIYRWDWVRPRIVDLFSLARYKIKKVTGHRKKEMELVTVAIFSEIISLIDSIRATPILAYLPEGKEITAHIGKNEQEEFMFSLCEKNKKARCFSTRPFFAGRLARGQRFKSDGHWEPAAHFVAAEALMHYLVNETRSVHVSQSNY